MDIQSVVGPPLTVGHSSALEVVWRDHCLGRRCPPLGVQGVLGPRPCLHHLRSIGRPDEEWDNGLAHLLHTAGQTRAYSHNLCLGGDLNASSLAIVLGGVAEDEGHDFRGGISHSLSRSMDLLDLVPQEQLLVLVPEGGCSATLVPYDSAQGEHILDHIILGGESRATIRIEKEWVAASGHLALRCSICCPSARANAGSLVEYAHDPHRFVKRNRKRPVRRRWPGWREEVVGQFAALLPSGVWTTVDQLCYGQHAQPPQHNAARPVGRQ